ncbi:acyl-CoA thioester hydrolase/BAAT C-terminal domain-containing protein [Cellulomonas sp. RIT-PI-Y]|uniref:alpha/beta hydrolase family protein n=1 Tax=Cellulomonas sp. RIT-PI-Y TaxID=3035297 RepID=UPI0021D8B1CC|nr:acyl-CoA thioester hydrolase/BAAT C-terminal domain-containing protein [Cellulomonas sp. RIT-PI-Y]
MTAGDDASPRPGESPERHRRRLVRDAEHAAGAQRPRPPRRDTFYRVLGGVLAGAILLAVIGSLMGPEWRPLPVTDPLTVQSASTAIGDAPELEQYDVDTRVVEVQLDGAVVQARILTPVGASGPVPAVLFVHGAGTGKFEDAFVDQAYALAEAGVATMVPDKRLDTYSMRHRDYVAMAQDYLVSFDLLRALPEVDSTRVGIYAESEGAWIAPVMASERAAVDFVVLVSAPVVPPRQQAAFAVDQYLRNTGVPDQVFRAIPRSVGMQLPGGGFEYVDFDVAPYQRQMTQPVLAVYGTADQSMPIIQGAEQLIRDIAIAGNSDYTLRYYGGADHGIRIDGTVSTAFLRDLSEWVLGLPDTAHASPRIAGAQPEQLYLAQPVPQPRWLGDGGLLLVLIIGAVAVAVLLPASRWAAVGWRVWRKHPPHEGRDVPLTRRLTLLSAASIATVVALVWYLLSVARLALDYERNGWVVQGGWLGVRLLGMVAVVAAVLVIDRMRTLRRIGRPLAQGVVGHVAVWGTSVACAVLLVVLAYWGVYQLGI